MIQARIAQSGKTTARTIRQSTPSEHAAGIAAKSQESGRKRGGPKVREAEVLKVCMGLLETSSKVAIFWRQSTGAMKLDNRFLRFSFKGASDLMAVMVGGKFLACEVKAPGGKLSPEQEAFLSNVNQAGGYGLMVSDPAYLAKWLAEI